MVASDFELLRAWKGGDTNAGNELFDRCFVMLRTFFRTKVSISEVEDLMQRTLIEALEAVERFRGDASFKSFVLTIARRQLYRHIEGRVRHRQRGHVDVTIDSVRDLGISPSRVALARQEQQLIADAMQTLPIDMQTTLELFYWQQLRGPELAEVLGISPNTVRTRLHRAREALREALRHLRSDEMSDAQLDESIGDLGRALQTS